MRARLTLQERAERAAAGVGERLRAARHARGLTLEEVQAISGVDFNTLSRYERGKARPEAVNLFKLCTVLRVSADVVLGLPPHISRRVSSDD